MNTKTIKLAPQSLNIFFKTQTLDDKTKVKTLNADFRAVPANPEGATRAYFTGLDVSPEVLAVIKTLARPAIDKRGDKYLALGTVEAEGEVVAVRTPQEGDLTQEVSFRIRLTALKRATDTSTDELSKLLG